MKNTFLYLFLLFPFLTLAQKSPDTVIALQPVDLKVYFVKQSLLSTTSTIHSLNSATIQQQQPHSMLTALNTVAGIRMEERSPGSYRIAMRGSLIRSPFGIRNTKVYIDEFPLTDAGGNSYINLLDPNAYQNVTVLKGPDGSLYGANSGGIIKIDPFYDSNNKIELNLSTGSYGLFNQQLEVQRKINTNYQININQSYLRSDGYRDNTAVEKKSFQTSQQWDYNPNSQIRLFALYTDLAYQTPGGLTQQQYDENPRQARPTAGKIPGAVEQKAAIYNKTFFGGIAHQKDINNKLAHHISLFGSVSDFKNPFITNYETRDESNLGVRTYFSWTDAIKGKGLQMQVGAEGIVGNSKIKNYDNDKGMPTQKQTIDEIDNRTWNVFYRTQVEVLPYWHLEGSIGLNFSSASYKNQYPNIEKGNIDFDPSWMPRLATNYQWKNMAWRLSFAKGYSTPTLAEVRASDQTINTELQAEKGNNYEIGYKIRTHNNRLIFDLAAYRYNMDNGIIRQVNSDDLEYYSNAGQMKQSGAEASLWLLLTPSIPVIKELSYQGSVSYNHYRFGEYTSAGNEFKGNKITAVPDWVYSQTVHIKFPKRCSLNLYHNYTSPSPLNDANTVFSEKFNLLQAKLLWAIPVRTHLKLQLYFGVDNLLNEKYSLGNDINAFGGRYFNPAPGRNFYGGLQLNLL